MVVTRNQLLLLSRLFRETFTTTPVNSLGIFIPGASVSGRAFALLPVLVSPPRAQAGTLPAAEDPIPPSTRLLQVGKLNTSRDFLSLKPVVAATHLLQRLSEGARGQRKAHFAWKPPRIAHSPELDLPELQHHDSRPREGNDKSVSTCDV